MDPLLRAVFVWAYASGLACLLVALADRARERRVVGEVLVEQRDWGALRIAGMGGLAVGMLVAWFGRGALPPEWSFPLLLVVAFVQVYRPDFGDRVCGIEGVRYGWYVRSMADLEEWRLTGDHLRFRLLGIWRAVPLPRAEHERLREKLVATIPERESSFH